MDLGNDRLEEAWRRVRGTDCALLDRAAARSRIADTRLIESYLAARQAAFTTVAEHPAPPPPLDLDVSSPDEPASAAENPAPGPALPPESSRDADRRRLRSRWLTRCPLFAAALGAGQVSPPLVDVLATTLEHVEQTVVAHVLADEAELVETARIATPDGFRAVLRRRVDLARSDLGVAALERQRKNSKASTFISRDDGMHILNVALDPERGQALFAAIEQRVHQLRNQPTTTPRTHGELRLQAVIDLISGTASVVPEVLVIVDERTIRSGAHPATICETESGVPLPVLDMINLCAVAKVTAAIVDADGKTVEMGCASRTANRHQRRAARAMYRTCCHPGCDTPFTDCELHHVVHWEDGGRTELRNLIPLCFRHHHQIHEPGWNVTIDDRRTLTWHQPDGTIEVAPLRPLLTPPEPSTVDHPPPRRTTRLGQPPPDRAPPRHSDAHAA